MAEFFAELKRRQMFRVAAAYAVVAWLLLQVVNNLAPGLNLPTWALTLVIVLLAIGFPIALIFAWIHQLVPADGAAPQTATTKLDYVLAGALVLVIGLVSYQQLSSSLSTPTAQQASVAATSSQPQPSGISIAVLPFANLSGDTSQEFFSDGMTDEIMTTLAKVQSLRVVARESAFQFKGERNDMRAVGQALNAQYLINGSVRRAGDRVRITAQLVQANSGVGLWTDSYDRELKDIFATQEEIAQAIASALRLPLGLAQGQNPVYSTVDTDTYQQYLRAKAFIRASGMERIAQATTLLEQLVARNPDFAPAWALLARAYFVTPTQSRQGVSGAFVALRRIADESHPKAEAAARRAIQLDANNAAAYYSLGSLRGARGNFLEAEDFFRRALTLDPNNSEVMSSYGNLLASVGNPKQALVMVQQAQALEPYIPSYNLRTADFLWLNGQTDAALAVSRALPADFESRGILLATIYASIGRYEEAADALVEYRAREFPAETSEAAARLLRAAPTSPASAEALPQLGILGWIYAYVGAPDRAMEYVEGTFAAGDITSLGTAVYWHPSYASVRKTERFKAYMRNAGFVDYWRARGWPELCRPIGAVDFVCD